MTIDSLLLDNSLPARASRAMGDLYLPELSRELVCIGRFARPRKRAPRGVPGPSMRLERDSREICRLARVYVCRIRV